MVMSCYNCGVRSFGRCRNACPYVLRSRAPQENDLRLICFKCYHEVTEKRNQQVVECYNALHERVRQMRAQLDAENAASAPKKAKQSDEPEEHAAASSSTQKAKSSEEPQGVLPWEDPPPPAKGRPQGAWHWSVPHGSEEIPHEEYESMH